MLRSTRHRLDRASHRLTDTLDCEEVVVVVTRNRAPAVTCHEFITCLSPWLPRLADGVPYPGAIVT
jgi:hypothetical protein